MKPVSSSYLHWWILPGKHPSIGARSKWRIRNDFGVIKFHMAELDTNKRKLRARLKQDLDIWDADSDDRCWHSERSLEQIRKAVMGCHIAKFENHSFYCEGKVIDADAARWKEMM